MRHETILFYLEGFDRDELGSALNARIDRHLAGCEPCAAYAAQITPLNALLATAAQSLPSGFDAAIESVRGRTLRAVRQESQAPRPMAAWLGPIGRWSFAAPLALAAALLVFLVVSPSRKDTTMAPMASLSGAPAAPQGRPGITKHANTAQAASPNFVVLRKGEDVKIEWLRNGHPHHVRKSDNPAHAVVASAQTVNGSQWTDAAGRPAPGGVTFYLID